MVLLERPASAEDHSRVCSVAPKLLCDLRMRIRKAVLLLVVMSLTGCPPEDLGAPGLEGRVRFKFRNGVLAADGASTDISTHSAPEPVTLESSNPAIFEIENGKITTHEPGS